jgi:hypothetical protein
LDEGHGTPHPDLVDPLTGEIIKAGTPEGRVEMARKYIAEGMVIKKACKKAFTSLKALQK